MILDCPSCRTRYLVQIGLFASGGRHVRCVRCRHEWHATLPTHIDVFVPVQLPPDYHHVPENKSGAGEAPSSQGAASYPLPAVIKNWNSRRTAKTVSIAVGVLVVLVVFPILMRQQIVNKFPDLRSFYESISFDIDHSGKGLVFDQVTSELKYDGGTMRLVVDGVVHNSTDEIQLIPDIKARALGPDRDIIQSWWVPAPAGSVDPGKDVPFHTEVNAPMKRTIENVYLEFYAQDEQHGNTAP
jgi:predicted Zn finger-like uncharacterized protein